jgi:endoglucanase
MTLSLMLSAALALSGSGQAANNGVPESLWRHFTTGVNITRWFCYQPNYDANHLTTYLVPADYDRFKRLHLGFVRLCLSPEAVYDNGALNTTNAPYLDSALTNLTSANLAVLFDLHDNGQLKLDDPGKDNTAFVNFWVDVAKHYKGKFERTVVFELVNEPQFNKNPDVWYALQQQTVDAIRAVDPARTVMVSGTSWSGIDTLASMTKLPEKNLIYTYHCYDPFFFTHQGASWVGEYPGKFKDVPFPSSPEAVAAMLNEVDQKYWPALKDYGEKRYGQAYLQERLAKAQDWAKAHDVPVVLGEFGSYPPVAPRASRIRWFAAMRQTIESEHVAASVWGYDDAMGLGRRLLPDGALWLDPVTIANLYRK